MPRLPGISQKDAVRVFQKLGYRIVRESGHLILSNGERRLVIPRHVGLPRFRGQVVRSHAMTLRLSIDDQPDQIKTPVHGAAKARGH